MILYIPKVFKMEYVLNISALGDARKSKLTSNVHLTSLYKFYYCHA